MKSKLWIEIRELEWVNKSLLPISMYQWIEKKWSDISIFFPGYLIWGLQNIVEQYLRVMWLDSSIYPARVDLWFSTDEKPIIYEITTWFVDQVGSCLSLQQALWDDTWIESLSKTAFESSILTSEPYRPEYECMRDMFMRSGKVLWKDETDTTFVYGYPLDYMSERGNFIPWWRGLNAEYDLVILDFYLDKDHKTALDIISIFRWMLVISFSTSSLKNSLMVDKWVRFWINKLQNTNENLELQKVMENIFPKP